MGHYRSEMGYEEVDEEQRRYKLVRRNKKIKNMNKLLATKPLAEILVDIVEVIESFNNYVNKIRLGN